MTIQQVPTRSADSSYGLSVSGTLDTVPKPSLASGSSTCGAARRADCDSVCVRPQGPSLLHSSDRRVGHPDSTCRSESSSHREDTSPYAGFGMLPVRGVGAREKVSQISCSSRRGTLENITIYCCVQAREVLQCRTLGRRALRCRGLGVSRNTLFYTSSCNIFC